MSRIGCLFSLSVVLAVNSATAQEAPNPNAGQSLTTERQKMSYAVGVGTARALMQRSAPDLDEEALVRGLRDMLEHRTLLMSEQQYAATYHAYQLQLLTRIGKAREILALENLQAANAFLTENAKKEGVVTLPDGLEYIELAAGKGDKPTDEDTVTIHYRGMLLDGKEFDSTYNRDQPTTFPLKNSIAGWREVLKLMPVGAKWRVFVPPALAYGKKGAGEQIGPNDLLIFEMELVSIAKK